MGNEFSTFERKIAFFMKRFPALKNKLKRGYQILNYFVYRKREKVNCIFNVQPIEYKEYETFFGYYDKSPLNESETKIIFHATSFSTKKKPSHLKPVRIVLKDFKTQKVLYTDESHSYNWQQGSKLQWLNDEDFIYNFYDKTDNKLKSKRVNSNDFKVSIYEYPIYDTYKESALILNYRRLAVMRPDYGYQNVDKRFEDFNDAQDGIIKMNLKNKENELLFSLDYIKSIKYEPEFDNSKHKLNHIMISPKGDKFVFLHRWFFNGVKRDRFLVSDMDGGNLRILLDEGMISHYFWKDNSNIIAFASTKKEGDKYYNLNTDSFEVKSLDFKINGKFGDGHPNILNEDQMLIDTYPDKSRNKTLFLVDIKSNKVNKIGTFFESLSFGGETRCDLHPRWSPKGNYILVDSVHSNKKRSLFLIKTKKI